MARVRWGVLSTASIGRLVIEASRNATNAEVVAVASRDPARARAFAGELGLEASYGSYEEPLATSAADAARCFDAAETAGRHCVEGLMWRHHPQTALARKLVAAGTVGRLAYVRAALSVTVERGDIRRSVELGGGALGDLGCYCVSAIRMFAGEPKQVSAVQVHDGPARAGDGARVDLRMAATLRLPAGVLAQFDIALDLTRRDELELVGTEGRLVVPDPWLCRATHLELSHNGRVERIPVDPDGTLGLTDPDHDVYRIELDTVSAAIAEGTEPSFGRSDAIAQATVLEALYRSADLGVPVEVTSGG